MIYAAVLAGGSGLRMGGDMPKQFLHVGGRPIIIRSIDAFAESGLVDKIYVAVSADYIDYTKKLISRFCPDVAAVVLEGGSNRNETLFNVLKDIEKNLKTNEYKRIKIGISNNKAFYIVTKEYKEVKKYIPDIEKLVNKKGEL